MSNQINDEICEKAYEEGWEMGRQEAIRDMFLFLKTLEKPTEETTKKS